MTIRAFSKSKQPLLIAVLLEKQYLVFLEVPLRVF